jgi:transposase
MTIEVRAVIHFFYLLNTPDEDILAQLETAYGEGIVNLKTVQRWTSKFRDKKTDLDDQPRSGRPRRDEELPRILTMIEENPYLSQKKIAQSLSLHHGIVKRLITEELDLRRVNFRWVPHILNASQKLERIKISRKLFKQLNRFRASDFARVLTGDETWIYLDNPRSAIWADAEMRRPTRPKRWIGAKKVMFWVCFNPIGIVDIVMLPPGETFDRAFFVDVVLGNLKKKLAQTPDPSPERGHFFQVDNARPHLADHEIHTNNLTRLPHPAYSPDLAPADFWLFGYLKFMLEGHSFETAEELQEKVTEILMSIPTSTFGAVFEEWKGRLLRCIDAGGEYL